MTETESSSATSSVNVWFTHPVFNRNVGIFAATGYGKSLEINSILTSPALKEIIKTVVEYKGDHIILLHEDDSFKYCHWNRHLRYNPLKQEGIPEEVARANHKASFLETYQLLESSGACFSMFDQELAELYRGSGHAPTLLDFHALLMKKSRTFKSHEWREAAPLINKMKGLMAAYSHIFDCSQGLTAKQICENNIIFDFYGMDESSQKYLTTNILLNIFSYYLVNDMRGEKLRHLIIIDECKRVFDAHRDKRWSQGLSPMDIFISMAREFGIGVIVADQVISAVSNALKANLGTLMVGRHTDARNILEAARSLYLKPEQAERIVQLGIGEFIVRTACYPEPFIVNVPYREFRTSVDRDLLEERALKIDIVPRLNLVDSPTVTKLEQVERAILQAVHEDPAMNITELYAKLQLSRGRGTNLKNKLITAGLLEEFPIIREGRGSLMKVLSLTQAGREALELGDEHGKGGLKHKTVQRVIKRHMEARGFRAEIEYYVDGHLVDVACYRGKEKISIQVAQSAKNELSNIRKSLPSCDMIVVACANRSVMAQIKKQAEAELSEHELEKVRFCLEGRFFERGGKGNE